MFKESKKTSLPAQIPLSRGQRALWFLDRLAPGTSAYVLAGAVRVAGPLDVPALRHAFEALADRHPALRTSFSPGVGAGSEPVQRVLAQRSPTFVEEDAAGWDEAALEARLAELAWSPFDLERDPLLRVGVLHRGPDEHRLVVALHHIVADFWSLGVLLGELSVLYRAGDLPPLRS
ncbi:MAG TPA: condensation domain-containing protein, partial [Thermoanaerobaculia bacterium]|nr:condensation domain-containing protein [Thermoanaerobaculia bacterium]